jgi:hypothetical protein
MPARQSHLKADASRLAVAALAITLAAIPVAAAQERPCRLDFTETMTGPRIDAKSTEGSIQLGPKMQQPGGGFVMMGQGTAKVIYGGPEGTVLYGGCTIIKNREYTYSLQAVISSEDGRNGNIDLIATDESYPVAFKCMGASGRAETNTLIGTPPTVTMPMIDGATKDYSDVQRGITIAGTMSLRYCRPEPQ